MRSVLTYNLQPAQFPLPFSLRSPLYLRSTPLFSLVFYQFLVLNSAITFFLCQFLAVESVKDPLSKLTDCQASKAGIQKRGKEGRKRGRRAQPERKVMAVLSLTTPTSSSSVLTSAPLGDTHTPAGGAPKPPHSKQGTAQSSKSNSNCLLRH